MRASRLAAVLPLLAFLLVACQDQPVEPTLSAAEATPRSMDGEGPYVDGPAGMVTIVPSHLPELRGERFPDRRHRVIRRTDRGG